MSALPRPCQEARFGSLSFRKRVRAPLPAVIAGLAVAHLEPALAQPRPEDHPAPSVEAVPSAPIDGDVDRDPPPPGDAREGSGATSAPSPAVASQELAALRAELDTVKRTMAEQAQQISDLGAQLVTDVGPQTELALEHTVPLRIYGFADVGLRRNFVPEGNRFEAVWQRGMTFMLGNLNVYFDAHPHPDFRTLAEVRFSQYPHYAQSLTSLDGESTAVYDSDSSTGSNQVIWSGIVLERAHLEWTRFDLLNVRAGLFLTPFGIWNVDHSMAVLITQRLPQFFSREYYPTHQIGLEVSGLKPLGSTELEYHAWLGNGRTRGADVTDNKMVGGRLVLAHDGAVRVALGASGLYGRNAFARRSITSVAPFATDLSVAVEYDEFAGGADLTFDWKGLRLRWEGVIAREQYLAGRRDEFAPGAFRPDRTRADTYGLIAYRLPWAGLEPYLLFERDMSAVNAPSSIGSVGINVHLRPSIQLKANYANVRFDAPDDDLDFSLIDVRWVSVF
ncbi:MAG: hypothetical protein JW751_09820 [Polyangiaceae bacterium]|nr:hypothetical protein [Polyangiaceae bacterium]